MEMYLISVLALKLLTNGCCLMHMHNLISLESGHTESNMVESLEWGIDLRKQDILYM